MTQFIDAYMPLGPSFDLMMPCDIMDICYNPFKSVSVA